jgi:acylpyruvate hydrolase
MVNLSGFPALLCGDRVVKLSDIDPAFSVTYNDVFKHLDRVYDSAGRLDAMTAESVGTPIDQCNFLPPLIDAGRLICLGHNYRKHIAEMGSPMPNHPVLFSKLNSALVGHRAPIQMPHESEQLDYEAELVVVIGKAGRRIAESKAWDHVLGYTIFNDVSVRDFQKRTVQWFQGKNFDRTSPLGPAIVTLDELEHPEDLELSMLLNGEVMQRTRTSDFIFTVPYIVSYLSLIMELRPGDMIATGTPSGVGAGRKPPIFLRPGDTVKVVLEQVGTLENQVMG